MKFPWYKYIELPVDRINTLQVFITNNCNLKCAGCFVRNIMGEEKKYISIEEYKKAIFDAYNKGCKRITLIGGEPLLHPNIHSFIEENEKLNLKTTIYTNGYFLDNYKKEDLLSAKIRVSLYCESGKVKSVNSLPFAAVPFDVCFMVSRTTTA